MDNDAPSERSPLISSGKQSAYTQGLRIAMPPFIVYVVGVAFFRIYAKWPFLTANYVAAQMITTIGYGDFVVHTNIEKVFMAFYAILVVLVLAYYHSIIMGRAMEWQSEALRKRLRQLEIALGYSTCDEEAAHKFGTRNLAIAMLVMFCSFLFFGCIFFRLVEHCTCSYGRDHVLGCREPGFEICLVSGGYIKTWPSSFYMSAITLTTIGFGDYQPKTIIGRIVGIAWMLMGTACTVATLGTLSQLMFERAEEARISEKVLADIDSIDQQIFNNIDKNHDGALSRGEFIAYTAVKYGLIQESLMDQLNSIYDKLDPSGSNSVTMEKLKLRQHQKQVAKDSP